MTCLDTGAFDQIVNQGLQPQNTQVQRNQELLQIGRLYVRHLIQEELASGRRRFLRPAQEREETDIQQLREEIAQLRLMLSRHSENGK